jgi:hypothetical protein
MKSFPWAEAFHIYVPPGRIRIILARYSGFTFIRDCTIPPGRVCIPKERHVFLWLKRPFHSHWAGLRISGAALLAVMKTVVFGG